MRDELADTAPEVEALLEPLGTFGGSYIDNEAGGLLTVTTTQPLPESVSNELTAIVASDDLVVKTVPYTQAYLEEVDARMAYSDLWAEGYATGSSVNPLTSTNDVVFLPSAPAGAEDAWVKSFGPSLSITREAGSNVSAATRNFTSGPLYGGGWISGGGANCSTGYSNVRDSINRYYTITAGHCFPNGTNVYQGYSTNGNRRLIGGASSNDVYNGATVNCDCVPVGLIPSGTGTEETYVDNNARFRYTGIGSTPVVGQRVCQAGAASFEAQNGVQSCGNVISTSGSATVLFGPNNTARFTLTDRVAVAFAVRPGDSGAPVGRGTGLLGFISYAGSNGDGGYSKSTNVGSVNVRLGF